MELFAGYHIVNKEDVSELDNAGGVWALFGQRKDCLKKRKWYCLQVAATSCIRNEILKDMQLLDEEIREYKEKIPYINQFGEVVFTYPPHPSPREYLYSKYIKQEYYNFKFMIVCKEESASQRRSIEKEFAYKTKAIYWRNGKPFKTGEQIDYDNRKVILDDIADNGEVSQKVINPFVDKYNSQ